MADHGSPAEGEARRRTVAVAGARAASLVAELAEAQGLELCSGTGGPCDLLVLEASGPEDVRARAGVARRTLAVAPRRLRDAEIKALLAAGAGRVLDATASLLDAAFALSELLFDTFAEARRYGRRFGGTPVRLRRLEKPSNPLFSPGVLVAISRSGGFVETAYGIPEGARVEVELALAGRSVPVRGRVACAGEDGLSIEFALGDHEVAPELYALCGPDSSRRGSLAPPSGTTDTHPAVPPERRPSQV